MLSSRTTRTFVECDRRVLTPCRLRALLCLGVVLTLSPGRSIAERPQISRPRTTAANEVGHGLDRKARLLQSRQERALARSRLRQKSTPPSKPTKPPAKCPPDTTITHGLDVGPLTVGLNGAGVQMGRLKLVTGGKASTLANGTDPATGRPMLSLLDISGQLKIDVPCVLDRCRVTQVGGIYCIRNSPMVDFEARDCEFEAAASPDGSVAACVVLNARTLRRCIIKGGRDGIKLASTGGCLIEDCWIYGQISGDGSHCDGLQMTKGHGDWDTWMIRRCRFEGPWQRQTSALILQADTGDLSGVTVQNCFLSGGTYTVYTRAKTGRVITKIRVVGNVWANESWKYGPHSNECPDIDFRDNRVAPATSQTSPVSVNIDAAVPLTR